MFRRLQDLIIKFQNVKVKLFKTCLINGIDKTWML